MVKQLNKKLISILFSISLVLLAVTLNSAITVSYSQANSIISRERGRNFEIFTYSNGTHVYRSTFIGVNNGSRWFDYLYKEIDNDTYIIQIGLLGTKLYPSHAEFYNSNLTVQFVKSERWTVWRYSTLLHRWVPILSQTNLSFKSSSLINTTTYVNVTMHT